MTTDALHHDRLRIGLYWLSLAVLIVSQIYLLPKMLSTQDGLDFRLIWLAGKLWASGISPYSAEFLEAYKATFGDGPNSHFWVYPPYWWGISRPLASLPFETALLVWNVVNYALLILGAALVSFFPKERPNAVPYAVRFMSILALLSLVQATPFALALGQTSFLVLGGLALLLVAMEGRNRVLCAIGVALVMLKPNYGLFLIICLLRYRWCWRPIIAVACAYIVASLLVAAPLGLVDTVSGFLQNLSDYDAPHISAGQPENLTGLVHLLQIMGISIPSSVALGLCLTVSIVTGLVVKSSVDVLLAVAVFSAFLVPLHTYDLTFCVLLLVVLSLRGTRGILLVSLVPFVFLFRPYNLAALSGVTNPDVMTSFQGSLLASMGLMLLCILVSVHLWHSAARKA